MLIKRTKNNNIKTNPELAKKIIQYFNPKGFCFDPCRGNGAFYDNLPNPKDYCEITEGKDFLDYSGKCKITYWD